MDANPDGPIPLPNYITDGMLPHEYEPMRAARRTIHLALADYLSQLASYCEAQRLELMAEHIRREILEPFRSMDYDAALAGMDASATATTSLKFTPKCWMDRRNA